MVALFEIAQNFTLINDLLACTIMQFVKAFVLNIFPFPS